MYNEDLIDLSLHADNNITSIHIYKAKILGIEDKHWQK